VGSKRQQKDVPVESLPEWALNVYTARNVRRALQMYRKAHRRAPLAELFEQLAMELESGLPSAQVLENLRGRFDRLLETLETAPIRSPVVSARSICEEKSAVGRAWVGVSLYETPVTKEQQRADWKLEGKTLARDRCVLGEEQSPEEALVRLGELWPLGQPHWTSARWPTLAQLRREDRRAWEEDAPMIPCRGANLKLSVRLPERLIELFEPSSFELEYQAATEVLQHPQAKTPGKPREIGIYRKRDDRVRVRLPGRHGFRKPVAADVRASYVGRGRAGTLRLLWAFYSEHDGGLLFQPLNARPEMAHVQLFGLADQPRALRCLSYYIEGTEIDRPDVVDAFLARYDCRLDDLLVLALINASCFLVPLSGSCAGRVLRYLIRARRIAPFAESVEEGFAKMVGDVVRLSGDWGPVMMVGLETRESTLSLKKVCREGKTGR
jgi:hypothetical protein